MHLVDVCKVWVRIPVTREEMRGERLGYITKEEMEAALAAMKSQIVEEIRCGGELTSTLVWYGVPS